ncbi:helix-turn-helix domain-containing protein [Micromonospora sp. NPDC005163]
MPQPRDWLTQLGQNVRALREAAGLRQADLADLVGVSRASIANIEAGRQDTTVTVLLTLADALDTTAGTLLGEDPAPLSLLARIADGQRRIAGAFTEAAVLMERMGQDAAEMRDRMEALGPYEPVRPTEG